MKRVGILVVAYNAVTTLASVLDRIPSEFVDRVTKIIVNDDFSSDATYLVGLGYREARPNLPLEVIRHPHNLGYGGNQKAGYRWAIEQDLDIVVLLHGDGQYAPELLPEIVAPLERGECDAVFGSRMMTRGAARAGGMPLYKYLGNRVLTTVENSLTGMQLSEWHSGYRAYSVAALRDIPFEANADGFEFDTQIILQLTEAGKRIAEVPIPTYYGDEISYVNGVAYARDILRDVIVYRAHRMGLGTGDTAFATTEYEQKLGATTSHGRIVELLARRAPARVLDVGCADGQLGERIRQGGHTVVGVDRTAADGVVDRLDGFAAADLDDALPPEVGDGYDVVLAADVLEHVRDPERLLADLTTRLAPGGVMLVSVPNFGHWYPRAKVVLGRFDYDRRGILDRDHVRFFTRSSFERLARRAGLVPRRLGAVGVPIEVAERGGASPVAEHGAVDRAQAAAVAVWPTLFGYQLLYELRPAGDQREA
jgi:glycosyltransferase involved in cell wall biosynthesis